MNRPDWCPQDVWASANDVCNALGYILVDDQIAIARAIQNERERCAGVAINAAEQWEMYDEYERASDFRDVAAAIRAGDPA